jgi:hypothetical protein
MVHLAGSTPYVAFAPSVADAPLSPSLLPTTNEWRSEGEGEWQLRSGRGERGREGLTTVGRGESAGTTGGEGGNGVEGGRCDGQQLREGGGRGPAAG